MNNYAYCALIFSITLSCSGLFFRAYFSIALKGTPPKVLAKEAKKNFLKSLQLNPRYTQSHIWFGHYYLTWVEGKFEEGEKHLDIAIQLEPFSSITYLTQFAIALTAGKYDQVFHLARQGFELDPDSMISNRIMGLAYLYNKQYPEARSILSLPVNSLTAPLLTRLT